MKNFVQYSLLAFVIVGAVSFVALETAAPMYRFAGDTDMKYSCPKCGSHLYDNAPSGNKKCTKCGHETSQSTFRKILSSYDSITTNGFKGILSVFGIDS